MPTAHRNYFNQLAPTWSVNPEEDEWILAHLKAFGIVPDDRVLDVGCGTGRLAPLLRCLTGHGGLVVGTDFAEHMLRRARRAGNACDHVCSDACCLAYKSASFDKVICFSTFPHILSPIVALREIHRVLRPGGRLLILHTCCSRQLNEFHAQLNGVVAQDHLPRAQELEKLLRRISFNVVKINENPKEYRVEARKPGESAG
ncbi:class I SAM-dependent methyltransferase [candidate division KSB1 bacterium]|nr:class I SAM-dependent methyltransferase [candidate division KSB1 bacterium]